MAKNKKNKSGIPVFLLIILPLLAMVIASFVISKGLENYITTSEYFNVRELKAEGIADERYLALIKNEVVGDNIFRLDVGNLAVRIRQMFPTFHSVTVMRILPSQLLIVAKERKPVAMLKQDMYYLLDSEGVVLSSANSGEELDLPLITGIENKLPKIRLGLAYQLNSLHKALLLAKALKSKIPPVGVVSSLQGRLKVTRIDVVGANESFFIGDNIEVKIGDRDIDSRLDLLSSILRSLAGDFSNIKYIDLRLKEPVVARKTAKNNK